MDFVKAGRRIRALRREQGLTQEQLADMTQLSPNHISDIERGVKMPQVDTLIRIANALETTADQILIDYLSYAAPLRMENVHNGLDRLPVNQRNYLLRVFDFMIQAAEDE